MPRIEIKTIPATAEIAEKAIEEKKKAEKAEKKVVKKGQKKTED